MSIRAEITFHTCRTFWWVPGKSLTEIIEKKLLWFEPLRVLSVDSSPSIGTIVSIGSFISLYCSQSMPGLTIRADLTGLGRGRLHGAGVENGAEHEDHEEQVFQPRGIAQQGSPLSLRPPHHRDHRLHRLEPHLRRRVHRLEIHWRQLVPLGPAQVSGQLLGHYKKI